MSPSDMIEWTYKDSGELAQIGETLWSSVMKRYVPIGGEAVHLLVSINDRTYSWINVKGLFHARVDDSWSRGAGRGAAPVVPRTRANL